MSANLMNSLLFLASIVFYMGVTTLIYRKMGRVGIFIWSAISVIFANIEAMKMVTMFGLPSGLGNAVYASCYLATDILSEIYGKKDGIKAVNIGLISTVIWVIFGQQLLWFIPNSNDFINPALQQIFELSPAFCLTSIFTYAVTQRLDVHLYHYWWKLCDKLFKGDHHKGLWLRNNGSTLLSQLFDTIIFMVIIAVCGIYPWEILPEMIVSTYIFKAAANLLDTPFVYLARHWKEKGKVTEY